MAVFICSSYPTSTSVTALIFCLEFLPSDCFTICLSFLLFYQLTFTFLHFMSKENIIWNCCLNNLTYSALGHERAHDKCLQLLFYSASEFDQTSSSFGFSIFRAQTGCLYAVNCWVIWSLDLVTPDASSPRRLFASKRNLRFNSCCEFSSCSPRTQVSNCHSPDWHGRSFRALSICRSAKLSLYQNPHNFGLEILDMWIDVLCNIRCLSFAP